MRGPHSRQGSLEKGQIPRVIGAGHPHPDFPPASTTTGSSPIGPPSGPQPSGAGIADAAHLVFLTPGDEAKKAASNLEWAEGMNRSAKPQVGTHCLEVLAWVSVNQGHWLQQKCRHFHVYPPKQRN